MIHVGSVIFNLLNEGDSVIYNCDTPEKLMICENYCNENSYNIVEIIEFKNPILTLEELENITNSYYFNLIIYSVKELNLNLKNFISLLEKCKEHHIIIHFVKDNLISTSQFDLRQIITMMYDNFGI